jgi:hypothetical protein
LFHIALWRRNKKKLKAGGKNHRASQHINRGFKAQVFIERVPSNLKLVSVLSKEILSIGTIIAGVIIHKSGKKTILQAIRESQPV